MSVAMAVGILQEHRYTALPVLDEDGARRRHPQRGRPRAGHAVRSTQANPAVASAEAMTRDVVCVRDDSTRWGRSPASMVGRRLRLLPVVDHEDRMVGVVSRGDLLRASGGGPT